MIKKCLPIKYPIITSFPYHSCILAALSAYDYALPWICGNYIQMKAKTYFEDYQILDIQFLMFDFEYSDVIPFLRENSHKIFKNTLDCYLANARKSIIEYMIENLENGYYLIMHLDDYYRKYAEKYQKNHICHQVIIYGYDMASESIMLGGVLQNNKFGFKEIKFSEFEYAYKNTNANYSVRLIKIQKEKGDFLEYQFVRDFVHDYYYSLNSTSKMGIYSPTYYEKGYAYGLEVYNVMNDYLTAVLNIRQGFLDIRRFHLLWDHMKTMIELSNCLTKKAEGNCMDLCGEYEKIANQSLILRNLALKYNISSDIRIISSLQKKVIDLREVEKVNIKYLLNDLSQISL